MYLKLCPGSKLKHMETFLTVQNTVTLNLNNQHNKRDGFNQNTWICSHGPKLSNTSNAKLTDPIADKSYCTYATQQICQWHGY